MVIMLDTNDIAYDELVAVMSAAGIEIKNPYDLDKSLLEESVSKEVMQYYLEGLGKWEKYVLLVGDSRKFTDVMER